MIDGAILEDVFRSHFVEVGPLGALAVALAMALAGIGPWLARRAPARTAKIVLGQGAAQIDAEHVLAIDVTGFSVAEAARGYSIAIARGARVLFVEVERIGEAVALARALNLPSTRFGTIPSPQTRVARRKFQIGLTSALLFTAWNYWACWWTDAFLGGDKSLYGIVGIVLAHVATVLVAIGVTPGPLLGSKGLWEAHHALHLDPEKVARAEAAASRLEKHSELERGAEPVATWLGRVDAMPALPGAYRGSHAKKDVLWETLNDGAAATSARVAAARVLGRAFGEEGASLVRVVNDPELRVRVEAALEDDAAERLEELGPLFRA